MHWKGIGSCSCMLYALKGHWKLFLHVVCIERILEVVLAWKEIEHRGSEVGSRGGGDHIYCYIEYTYLICVYFICVYIIYDRASTCFHNDSATLPSARLPYPKPHVQTLDSTKTMEDSGGLRWHWKIICRLFPTEKKRKANCLVLVWLQQGLPRISWHKCISSLGELYP